MACVAPTVVAQQTNSVYFMKGLTERNAYNPALQSYYNFYIDLPLIPNWNFDMGLPLSMNDIIFNKNGKPVMFLNENAMDGRDKFYNALGSNSARTYFDWSINVLGFGFKAGSNYFTFNVAEKIYADMFLPKDFFGFALYGTGKKNKQDFSTLGIDATAYLEYALGYSRKLLDDKLSVGVKLKLLSGQFNIKSHFDDFSLNMTTTEWRLKMQGNIKGAIPAAFMKIGEKTNDAGQEVLDFDNIEFAPDGYEVKDYLKAGLFSGNFGFGADIGVAYEVIPNLQLSAAVTDIGFIKWKNADDLYNITANAEYAYEGIPKDEFSTIEDYLEDELDNLGNTIEDGFQIAHNPTAYKTKLRTRLNIGAEYGFFNDKLGLGLLYSRLFIENQGQYQDLIASLNWRPCKWFNPMVSYSFLEGKGSTMGAGYQLKLGPINTFIVVDNIPLYFGKLKSSSLSIPYPSRMKGLNVQAGVTLVFGSAKLKDDDGDGVANKKDKCPNTIAGYLVDKIGCPIDEDGDGVADNVDKCPGTPKGVAVDEKGCPIDSDGDGVPDYLDKCPNTPAGIQVDENGCPPDSDGDGVPDYLDKCPNTPQEAFDHLDENGCPKDSDGDGVFDYLDKCPNTPQGVEVDENGCPKDSDGDGVPDYLDKCPNTPKEAFDHLDENGCPKDTDGDGIPDYQDNCPNLAGVVSNKGCPEIKEEVRKLFKRALNGIQFETGKATIKKTSNPILNEIVKVMDDNPSYLLTISGHTDNVGKPESNQILSENRAKAVKDYLIEHGIKAERLTALGFGDTQPVATNKTTAGRAQNRRVDLEVKFETIEYK
jgi:outer membrane protein OmpA-like peptidoglycan-associated protein